MTRGRPRTRLVVVESPFGSDDDEVVAENITYARACLADCFKRGEAPFASHLLYTQAGVLDDRKPRERKRGIRAGFAWGELAAVRVVYVDRGFSRGMVDGLVEASRLDQPIEVRSLWTRAGPALVDLTRRALARLSDGHSHRALAALGPPYASG